MNRSSLLSPLCSLFIAFSAPSLVAQHLWINTSPSGGDWYDSDNWDKPAPPNSGQNARIDNQGKALLSSGTTAVNDLYVGYDTTDNELVMSNATLSLRSLYFGFLLDSSGKIVIGDGATLSPRGEVLIGNSGNGTLDIAAGGTLQTTHGTLRISNQRSSTSTVNLNGTWTTEGTTVFIGFRGAGTLNLGAGGLLDIGATGQVTLNSDTTENHYSYLTIGGKLIDNTPSAATAPGTLNAATVRGASSGHATISFNHTSSRHAFTNSSNQAIAITGTSRTSVQVYAGTTVLSAQNTYQGGTVIHGGTLLANHTDTGSSTGTGTVSVRADGTLGGIGFINGATTVEGTLAAGNLELGYGTLSFRSSLTLGEESLTLLRLNGTTVGSYDTVDVTGALTYDGTLRITLDSGLSLVDGQRYDFNLFGAGSRSGTFSALDLSDTFEGMTLNWDTTQLYSTGTLGLTAEAIPEPAALLWMTGLASAFLLFRRRGW